MDQAQRQLGRRPDVSQARRARALCRVGRHYWAEWEKGGVSWRECETCSLRVGQAELCQEGAHAWGPWSWWDADGPDRGRRTCSACGEGQHHLGPRCVVCEESGRSPSPAESCEACGPGVVCQEGHCWLLGPNGSAMPVSDVTWGMLDCRCSRCGIVGMTDAQAGLLCVEGRASLLRAATEWEAEEIGRQLGIRPAIGTAPAPAGMP